MDCGDHDRGEGPSTRRRRIVEVAEPAVPPSKRTCTVVQPQAAHDRTPLPRPRLRLRFTVPPSSTPPVSAHSTPPPDYHPPPVHYPSYACRPSTPRHLVGGGKPRRRARRDGSDDEFQSQAQPRAQARARAPRAQRRTRSRRQSATPTTLESIASESAAVRAEVARLGLALRDVMADGNCLFRALGDQLWGEQGRHTEIRQLVCDYLISAKDDLGDFVAGFLNEGETYDRYVERMRGPGVYGSHIELLAASRVFRRSIRIVLAQTSYTVEFNGPNDPPPQTAMEPDDVAAGPATRRRTRASTIDSPRPGHTMLWLALFAEAEHYESVRRVGPGASSGPAEVPNDLVVPHQRDVSEAARSQRASSGDASHEPEGVRKRSAQAERYVTDGRVAQVLASLPPWHGISDDDAANMLVRCDGDVSRAIDTLYDQLDSDGDGDGEAGTEESDTSADVDADAKVVDAMLYRTTSGSSVSTAMSGSTAATSAMSTTSVRSGTASPPPTPSTAPKSPSPESDELEHDHEHNHEHDQAHAQKSPKTPPPARITRSQARRNPSKRVTRSSKM